ncbi:substrate-binding domain-containing protein [Herbiconiux sp. P16]|uniref:substrate-binding domain-containing protein n=1 Tax=Herbiconiux wuyangfengii TaxID=3342794 RepID=UPI0035B9AE96
MNTTIQNHARGRRSTTLIALASAGLLLAALTACSTDADAGGNGGGSGDKPLVGLITKTEDPYYVSMKKGAQQTADELGFELQSLSGKDQSDNDAQVAAIENLVASGAVGIMITPADSEGILPAIKKARDAGVWVAVLDSPTDPTSAADATFATDNYSAGQLIGEWAKADFAAADKDAKIAMLDLAPSQPAVDVQRDQGFLDGFGIDLGDPAKIGDENDPQIVGNEVTNANEEGGRTAMEKLIQVDPSINLVYTINEPAAAGAYESIKAAGLTDQMTIVSIDGGCAGVQNVADGVIQATSMQFPLKMAQDALEALKDFLDDGTAAATSPGLDYTDTGVQLITDTPVDGVDSQDSAWGLENCWG